MKKENKELAKQRKAQERAAEERKKMGKTIAIICAIAAIIGVLIIVTAIQSGTPEEADTDSLSDITSSSSVSTDDEDSSYSDTASTDTEEDGDTDLDTTEGTVCEDGDTVAIHFEGFIDDDYQFEGGTGDYDLTLGSHSFITGFEEGLVGHKVGETVTLDLNFPDDYFNNTTNAAGETISLAGVPVKFVVTINGVYK